MILNCYRKPEIIIKMIKLKELLQFSPDKFSHIDEISNDIINNIGKEFKEYKNCNNNNLISERSLSRVIDYFNNSDKDFCIITAFRNEFTFYENLNRNQKLRTKLNSLKMGVHLLLGHWQEESGDKKSTIDVVERSFLVPKPDTITFDEFLYTMKPLMVIDGKKQDSLLFKHKDKYFLFNNDESVDFVGDKMSLNKIAQAYSQYVLKLNKNPKNIKVSMPFVFEGMEYPGSNSGKKMFKSFGILY